MSITNNNYTIIYNSDGYNIILNDEIDIEPIKPIKSINPIIYNSEKNIIKLINKTNTFISELPVDKLSDYLHR